MTIQHHDLYDTSQVLDTDNNSTRQSDDTDDDRGFLKLRDTIRQILDEKSGEIHDLNLASNAGRLVLSRIIAESLKTRIL
tara:strand:+ start:247 stop:486 length:240 start_codon:yes stop_codon:yes gene_type:complete